MQVSRALLVLALAVAIAAAMGGCASTPTTSCRASEQSAVQEMLYFGTGKPNGVVSRDEWTRFLATVVTPRFPQGLTVFEASGQWRGADGTIVHESTYVLQLLHPEDPASEASVLEIAASYKSQFQQESVLRVRSSTCVTF